MSKWRTLVTPQGEFEWRYGGRGVIVRQGDVKHNVHVTEVTGLQWDDVERGQWKRTSDGMITPGQVRAWIDKNV